MFLQVPKSNGVSLLLAIWGKLIFVHLLNKYNICYQCSSFGGSDPLFCEKATEVGG